MQPTYSCRHVHFPISLLNSPFLHPSVVSPAPLPYQLQYFSAGFTTLYTKLLLPPNPHTQHPTTEHPTTHPQHPTPEHPTTHPQLPHLHAPSYGRPLCSPPSVINLRRSLNTQTSVCTRSLTINNSIWQCLLTVQQPRPHVTSRLVLLHHVSKPFLLPQSASPFLNVSPRVVLSLPPPPPPKTTPSHQFPRL